MQADVGQAVLLADEDRGIRTLTINRPDQLNALNNAVFTALETQLDEISASDQVRVLILTGAGSKSFAAGADIKELQHLTPLTAEVLSSRVQQLFQRFRELPIPVIAAVNGFALGGGLELALACDFMYVADNAKLGLVESHLGLIPGYSGVSRLMNAIGERQAIEALYTARKFTAVEAVELGIANRCVPSDDLMTQVHHTAANIAVKSRNSLRQLKQLMAQTRYATTETARTLEQQAFGLIFADPNAQEGIQAFLDKRTPEFR